MGLEIEKKFLLKGNKWRIPEKAVHYRQGYLSRSRECIVRVRTIKDKGFLTIKGITIGATRAEYEYEIPKGECNAMLENLAEKPIIEKNRYTLDYKGFTWEIDEFLGENQGLVVAEIELDFEDQKFDTPEWVGKEVTGDPRYFNSNLICFPYTKW